MMRVKEQIIDFHSHIGADQSAERLLASMLRAGITCSVLLPVVTGPEEFQRINNAAAKVNARYGGKLLSFGSIHPLSQQYKQELHYIKSLGLLGIKLHPDLQGVQFDHREYLHIIDYASELGLAVAVHAGITQRQPMQVKCPPRIAAKVIEELQPPRLILTHLGGFKQWSSVEEELIGRQVYLDCAACALYMPKEQFERIVNRHGSDKILFATDFPETDPRDMIEWIEKCDLTEKQKQNIYKENACRLLKLHAPNKL